MNPRFSKCWLKILTIKSHFMALIAIMSPIIAVSQGYKIDGLFNHLNSKTPGAAIAVVQNGDILYSKCYGMANLAYGAPFTDTTLLDIASCAKTFTAYGILLLEMDGKLSLDDEITKYLSQFPDYGNKITIRQLGTHTSGIREWIQLFHLSGYQLDGDPILNDHLLNLIYNQKDINFPPGSKFNYSNSNYVLLAEIIERISGQTFATFMHERVFTPLNMHQTFFNDDLYGIKYNEAARYMKEDSAYKQIPHFTPSPGAGALYTTTKDIVKWLIFINDFINQHQSETELVNQMVLTNGDTISSTFGLYYDPYKGHSQLQHEGGGVGINSYMGFFPDQNISIFVSCNDYACSPHDYALQVVDLFLPEISGAQNRPTLSNEPHQKGTVHPEKWEGDYWSDDALISRKIIFRDNKLFYVRTNGSETALISSKDNQFTFEGSFGIKVWFESDTVGNRIMYYKYQNDPPNAFIEYVPFALESKDLNQYSGIYYSEELKSIYSIEKKGDNIYATHLRQRDIPLQQVMADVFTGSRTAFSQVRFLRTPSGAIDGFSVSSRNAKGINFVRIAD